MRGWSAWLGLAAALVVGCGGPPERHGPPAARPQPAAAPTRQAAPVSGAAGAAPLEAVPGGSFVMGTDDGFPYEGPAHSVTLPPFRIDRHEVTVEDFAVFVAATGHRTEAEAYGWSGVFDQQVHGWTKVDGADWQHPEGPAAPAAVGREPVTQVSWADAVAYCRWRGARLPTEAEFERAARGGSRGVYAWGDELVPGGKYQANVWQGHFPERNTAADGFAGRAPIESFAPNDLGLYDMTGNVWEWVADWYDPDYYAESPEQDPKGPASGSERGIRGGSFLCSENYCVGYRLAARSHSAPDSGLNNLGFRCAL